MMYGDWHGGRGWGAWVAMGLMMLAFLGLLVAVVVLLVRGQTRSSDGARPAPPTGHEHAERILAERFARGEIEADDYTRRRDLLRSS